MLREFLEANRATQTLLARAIGCSDAMVSMWLCGTRRPNAARREAIRVFTSGKIPPEMWMTDEERERIANIVVPLLPPPGVPLKLPGVPDKRSRVERNHGERAAS